jgi:hypothetical protein
VYKRQSKDRVKEVIPLTEIEKRTIKDFAITLTRSLNNYEYELIEKVWDNQLFKRRVKTSNKIERNLLNHFFEEEIGKQVYYVNIDLINKLKFNNGNLKLSKIIYYPRHVEIIYSMTFDKNVDFWKYRIELKDSVPKLSDYYSYRDEFWQSDNLENFLKLNTKYTAVSKERQQANSSLIQSEKYLGYGDSLRALDILYEVPSTHSVGNAISLKRINLAYEISDTTFASVLLKEKELNNSLYINYLYAYYFGDTIELNNVFSELNKELGVKNDLLDSLKTLNYFWK